MREVLNGEVGIEYPESFSVMDQDELAKYYTDTSNRHGIRNAENRTVISVGWTDPLSLPVSLLINERSFVKSFDKRYRKALKEYMRTEDISGEFSGRRIEGFAFVFTASDTGEMCHGKLAAFRLGRRIYYVEYSSGNRDTVYCDMAFKMVVSSMKLL